MRVVFLHGLESRPQGSKFQALKSLFSDVSAPDCEGVMDVQDRVQIILDHLGEEPALLVGSSMGALVGALVYQQRPDLVLGAVFCAPAFVRPEMQTVRSLPKHSVIIHGDQDELFGLNQIAIVAEKFGIPLVQVSDGHRLSFSEGVMLEQVRKVQSLIERHA